MSSDYFNTLGLLHSITVLKQTAARAYLEIFKLQPSDLIGWLEM